ncbi:pR47 [rat cytomegalovirus strain Maastricht]|uniref:PR47 n=1 Tax=Rat cytomegalovirus (strain Maastricht) TaxID=79700 RepID=Q9DWE3_RCMVM|nr:pR47 [rat cytomegalovirus strain Maastricht]AAF99146.1 pR47 [rat cytomegalovirus strain Maastricht]WEG71973.1 tegument protein UL37 [Murid betaherpesvirus 2]
MAAAAGKRAQGNRALNLDQTLEDLRLKTTSDEDLLNILAKIEISAVQLQTVTSPRIRRFLKYVPTGAYHFDFIHRNPVFYFLNHGTFAPAERGRFLLAAELLGELRKHGEKNPGDKKEQSLSGLTNAQTLRTLSEFLHEVNRVGELQKFLSDRHLIDEEDARPQNRIKEFGEAETQALEKIATATEPLRNCRAIAELLEEMYRGAFEAFRVSFTHRTLRRAEDTELDALVKMIHCHEHHARTAEAEAEFRKAVDKAGETLARTQTTDIHEIQQPGAEYTREASFKISSRSLTARERTDVQFPVLAPSLSLLKHVAPPNVLFHPGAVFAILRAASREEGSEQIVELHAFNDFCATIGDILFAQTPEPRLRSARLADILHRTRAFYRLGLTPRTSATYVRMVTLRSIHRHSPRNEVAEAADHISFLAYNAHLHFLCLARYSNTFLFHHAKKLILEQQRSLLTGNRALEDVWTNAAFNVNRIFATRYDEDEFLRLTRGIPAAGRDYLYRDAANKWDDIGFPPEQEDVADPPPLPPQTDPTNEDIARACELLNGSDDGNAYNSLLPLSTYPDFDRILTKTTVIPQLTAILNASPAEARAHDDARLLKLIHACRLLMPRRLELYRSLVSLYNLLHYVSHTDLGLVKVLYSVIRNAVVHVSEITGEDHAFDSYLLEDLAAESFVLALETDVSQTLRRASRHRERIARRFAAHCRLCGLLPRTRASLYTNTNTVILSSRRAVILKVSLPTFAQRLESIVAENAELEDGLRFVTNADERILELLRSLTADAKAIPSFTDLTFSTRGIARLHAKIADAVQAYQMTLRDLCDERIQYNRAACEIFGATAAACRTLEKSRIAELGLRRCVTDATALIESHRSPPQAPIDDELDQESMSVLKKAFATDEGLDATPSRREMTGAARGAVTEDDFDYARERFVPPQSIGALRDWYVETREKAQRDLTTPLRLSRATGTPPP